MVPIFHHQRRNYDGDIKLVGRQKDWWVLPNQSHLALLSKYYRFKLAKWNQQKPQIAGWYFEHMANNIQSRLCLHSLSVETTSKNTLQINLEMIWWHKIVVPSLYTKWEMNWEPPNLPSSNDCIIVPYSIQNRTMEMKCNGEQIPVYGLCTCWLKPRVWQWKYEK